MRYFIEILLDVFTLGSAYAGDDWLKENLDSYVEVAAQMGRKAGERSSLGLLKISPGRRRGRFTLSSTDILHLECSIFFFQPIGAVSFDLRLNLRI